MRQARQIFFEKIRPSCLAGGAGFSKKTMAGFCPKPFQKKENGAALAYFWGFPAKTGAAPLSKRKIFRLAGSFAQRISPPGFIMLEDHRAAQNGAFFPKMTYRAWAFF